jgi:DNA-binding transcriptional LysR family regulator
MDIVTLRTFLAAAEAGTFAAAAQRVNASPSSVTERIKQLEHLLGARLFDRGKKGCTLTQAGQKFLIPAARAVRTIETARREIAFPEKYTRSVTIGAQYVFWEGPMMDWLGRLRGAIPDLAMRVSAGASARLSRELAEGFLDVVLLYDPVFRHDIGSEPLFSDKLVLVTGGEVDNWRRDYVQIEWGEGWRDEIGSRLDLIPEAGLILDLGARSAQWLIGQRMAGYMPRRAVASMLENGALRLVEDAPQFEYPAYICWRRDMNAGLAAELVRRFKGLSN